MNAMEKEALYDKLCRILTDYEMPEDCQDPVTEADLYDLLVEIQNSWYELISKEEE